MCMHNAGQKFGHSLPDTEGCLCSDGVEMSSALLQTQLVSVQKLVLLVPRLAGKLHHGALVLYDTIGT